MSDSMVAIVVGLCVVAVTSGLALWSGRVDSFRRRHKCNNELIYEPSCVVVYRPDDSHSVRRFARPRTRRWRWWRWMCFESRKNDFVEHVVFGDSVTYKICQRITLDSSFLVQISSSDFIRIVWFIVMIFTSNLYCWLHAWMCAVRLVCHFEWPERKRVFVGMARGNDKSQLVMTHENRYLNRCFYLCHCHSMPHNCSCMLVCVCGWRDEATE